MQKKIVLAFFAVSIASTGGRLSASIILQGSATCSATNLVEGGDSPFFATCSNGAAKGAAISRFSYTTDVNSVSVQIVTQAIVSRDPAGPTDRLALTSTYVATLDFTSAGPVRPGLLFTGFPAMALSCGGVQGDGVIQLSIGGSCDGPYGSPIPSPVPIMLGTIFEIVVTVTDKSDIEIMDSFSGGFASTTLVLSATEANCATCFVPIDAASPEPGSASLTLLAGLMFTGLGLKTRRARRWISGY